MEYCPKCGAVIQLTRQTAVHGWLLLICIALVVVYPIISITALDVKFELLGQITQPEMIAAAKRLVQMESIRLGLISLLGVISGLLIWNRRPLGLLLAKCFFTLIILQNLFLLAFPEFTNLPKTSKDILLGEGRSLLFFLTVAAILALGYLYRSPEVRRLFPQSR